MQIPQNTLEVAKFFNPSFKRVKSNSFAFSSDFYGKVSIEFESFYSVDVTFWGQVGYDSITIESDLIYTFRKRTIKIKSDDKVQSIINKVQKAIDIAKQCLKEIKDEREANKTAAVANLVKATPLVEQIKNCKNVLSVEVSESTSSSTAIFNIRLINNEQFYIHFDDGLFQVNILKNTRKVNCEQLVSLLSMLG